MDTGKSEILENIGLRTRSKSNTDEAVDKNEDRPDKEEEKENDEIEDDFYSCKICSQSFQKHEKI